MTEKAWLVTSCTGEMKRVVGLGLPNGHTRIISRCTGTAGVGVGAYSGV